MPCAIELQNYTSWNGCNVARCIWTTFLFNPESVSLLSEEENGAKLWRFSCRGCWCGDYRGAGESASPQYDVTERLILPVKDGRVINGNSRVTSNMDAGSEVQTVLKFQIKVFWIMTPCSVSVGLHPEDRGNRILRNVGIQHTASQPRRPWL
jgi:hypothetical protein